MASKPSPKAKRKTKQKQEKIGATRAWHHGSCAAFIDSFCQSPRPCGCLSCCCHTDYVCTMAVLRFKSWLPLVRLIFQISVLRSPDKLLNTTSMESKRLLQLRSAYCWRQNANTTKSVSISALVSPPVVVAIHPSCARPPSFPNPLLLPCLLALGLWGFQSKCCLLLLLKNCFFCVCPGATWGEGGGGRKKEGSMHRL